MDNFSGLRKKNMLIMNQMRIHSTYKIPGKGYSEALALSTIFNKVVFVCFTEKEHMLSRKIRENFLLFATPLRISGSVFQTVKSLFLNYLFLTIFLTKLVFKYKIHLIRVENVILAGLPVYLTSKITKTPYGVWLGGFERKALEVKYGKSMLIKVLTYFLVLLEFIVLRGAKFVFCVSPELKDLAQERGAKNVISSPNFVDFSKFKPLSHPLTEEKNIKFLYVGRLEEEKGIKVLMEATKFLLEKTTDFKLFIVGQGTLMGYIRDFVAKNKLEGYVEILGSFGHDDMPKIYNMSDVFILPSYTEGAPAAMLEAMACGRAIIATKVGMVPKILFHGKDGILINPGSPKELADAMYYFIINKDKISQFGENAYKRALEISKNYLSLHASVYSRFLK